MIRKTALIFGFNQYSLEIAKNIIDKYDSVKIYSHTENSIDGAEYDIEYFDFSDDWSNIEELVDAENSIAFCALEDSAQNVFLTISLRAYFQDLMIIAIASNKENANKLSMAGANKVIPIVETTADIINNILELPISNKVLHNILFKENDLKISQIKIEKHCKIKDEEILNIDWSRYNGIIVLSLMHEDMSSDFIYSSKVKHHVIKNGDTLVVVGYENDIKDFKKRIGSEI